MRQLFVGISAFILILIFSIGYFAPPVLWCLIIIIPLIVLGLADMIQNKNAIKHNFPLIGRLRYILGGIGPEIHQYFVENDEDGKPFSRLNRNVVYKRAARADDTMPFGTQLNIYEPGYEWLSHSITPANSDELNHDPRIIIGGPDCKKPYEASILNISAMSYGSLSQNAIMALNSGAKIGGFAHNTGEGGLSPYHLKPGGDIVWQLGTGYFGCRNIDGTFNERLFAERAVLPNVKMIEIKLSQGAKPGHGGILPAKKVSEEIAKIRLVEMGKDVISPPRHSAFSNPIEMMHFIAKLRELSGGKPVGFKLCVGIKRQFFAMCKAMVKTGITPDFITVDGGEGGTGAAPMEFSDSVGMPLTDGLVFVTDALMGFGLKEKIKIIASGKVVTGFDMIKLLSLGADACNSARAMMLALGCIQALRCNTNRCPTGVATQDASLQAGLSVEDKKVKVANFHFQTVKSAVDMMGSAGIKAPAYMNRHHINKRETRNQVRTYAEIYPYVVTGSMLENAEVPVPELYKDDLQFANDAIF
ncbi:MAG TPA: FMN-binding glutamate synthase family protein [Bacteroidia bacterium]|nr:FMN-binding glutamate synthase family protein [Bacteroidia bacterium]